MRKKRQEWVCEFCSEWSMEAGEFVCDHPDCCKLKHCRVCGERTWHAPVAEIRKAEATP